MSDNTPKEEVKGIPQDVADDIAALAADISAMSNRAARGWKITAVVWVILLCVIAGYLYLLVYRPLNEMLTPENVLQMGVSTLNGALASFGAPGIDSPTALGNWATKELTDAAPAVMQDRVKPQLEALLEELPKFRTEWTEKFKQEGPVWINDAVQHFGENVLPAANEALLNLVDKRVDELLAQFGDQIEVVVSQVMDQVDDITDQAGMDNQAEMRARFESAFEDAMGPVLDEVLADLDVNVREAGISIAELIRKYNAGDCTHKELLEVRLIQLTLGLFEGALEEAPTGAGPLDQLRQVLQEIGMPVAQQNDVIERARQAGPAGAPTSIEELLQNVPEERREEALKQYQADMEARARAMAQ